MSTDDGYNVGQADIGGFTALSLDLRETSTTTSWRSLLEVSSAKSRKIRGSNYVQLATVSSATSCEPRNRCVVFRGFLKLSNSHVLSNQCDDLSCVMKMITDSRSNKVKEVEDNKTAEMVWWFPKTSEQYRIRGDLVFVGSGQFEYDNDKELAIARKEQWGNLSDSARESFFHAQVPGAQYSGETLGVPTGGRDTDGKVLAPPDNFLLMLLVPRYCDYLRLQNMYRQIDSKSNDSNEWSAIRVNP